MIPLISLNHNGNKFPGSKKNLPGVSKSNFFYHIRVASANSSLIAGVHKQLIKL